MIRVPNRGVGPDCGATLDSGGLPNKVVALNGGATISSEEVAGRELPDDRTWEKGMGVGLYLDPMLWKSPCPNTLKTCK